MPRLDLSECKPRRNVGSSQSPPQGGVDKAAPAKSGGNLLLPALRDVNLSGANRDGTGLGPAAEPGKLGPVPDSPGFLLGGICTFGAQIFHYFGFIVPKLGLILIKYVFNYKNMNIRPI